MYVSVYFPRSFPLLQRSAGGWVNGEGIKINKRHTPSSTSTRCRTGACSRSSYGSYATELRRLTQRRVDCFLLVIDAESTVDSFDEFCVIFFTFLLLFLLFGSRQYRTLSVPPAFIFFSKAVRTKALQTYRDKIPCACEITMASVVGGGSSSSSNTSV